MKKLFVFIRIIVGFGISHHAFGQLEFTKEERLLFVGADSIEGKWIITGVYVIPVDSTHLTVEIDVLDSWNQKEKLTASVELDDRSLSDSIYMLKYGEDSLSAYRFFGNNGIEIWIAKEQYMNLSGNRNERIRPYYLTIAQIYLSEDRQFYVKTLPLMYEK